MLSLRHSCPRRALKVPNPFVEEAGPQPPKVLKAPVEIQANLRLLQDSRDSLLITFADRNQRFQSFLVDIDRDRGMVALDELIPNTGERFLQNGEAFRVEAFHEGVRIAWECERPVQFGEHDGVPCYWAALPAEVLYHQRRNAYRASIKQSQPIAAEIAGEKLRAPLSGQLLDISATGAKLRFAGNVAERLHPGEIYEDFSAQLPQGAISSAIELRHVRFDEKLDATFAGVRFSKMSGLAQRQVDRFVYQLQREARRFEKDELF
ncbi:TPA: flagellar brake protein [Pseudomonas aeruginosa]|nr:flagellar brake protein [Pseudomonas aeruginosa]